MITLTVRGLSAGPYEPSTEALQTLRANRADRLSHVGWDWVDAIMVRIMRATIGAPGNRRRCDVIIPPRGYRRVYTDVITGERRYCSVLDSTGWHSSTARWERVA